MIYRRFSWKTFLRAGFCRRIGICFAGSFIFFLYIISRHTIDIKPYHAYIYHIECWTSSPYAAKSHGLLATWVIDWLFTFYFDAHMLRRAPVCCIIWLFSDRLIIMMRGAFIISRRRSLIEPPDARIKCRWLPLPASHGDDADAAQPPPLARKAHYDSFFLLRQNEQHLRAYFIYEKPGLFHFGAAHEGWRRIYSLHFLPRATSPRRQSDHCALHIDIDSFLFRTLSGAPRHAAILFMQPLTVSSSIRGASVDITWRFSLISLGLLPFPADKYQLSLSAFSSLMILSMVFIPRASPITIWLSIEQAFPFGGRWMRRFTRCWTGLLCYSGFSRVTVSLSY